MTFSKFGSRVAQNASGGIDRDTENNMFFVNGDLKYQVCFKPVYATPY
ncbi:MAG: hypothetical protein J5I50_13390 [Chitinophagaceae bacterium]|nr:hypothetical protein [Chitinophagaceae bacterium]